MRQQGAGQHQHGQAQPSLPALGRAKHQQAVEDQEQPRQPGEQQRIVERPAHVHVYQVIGEVHVEHAGNERRQRDPSFIPTE